MDTMPLATLDMANRINMAASQVNLDMDSLLGTPCITSLVTQVMASLMNTVVSLGYNLDSQMNLDTDSLDNKDITHRACLVMANRMSLVVCQISLGMDSLVHLPMNPANTVRRALFIFKKIK